MHSLAFHCARLVVLASALAPFVFDDSSVLYAQKPASGRVRVNTDLTGKDPFAARAGRGSTPIVTAKPAVKEEPAETSQPSAPTPRATAPKAESDALYFFDKPEVVFCDVESISGAAGLTASIDGETQTIPLSELARVELAVSDAFLHAEAAYASGKKLGASSEYAKALDLYKEARQTTSRRLEKEWATAKIAETYSALGRDDEAVAEFFLLCRLDPYTPYLGSAPLRWINQTALGRGSSAEEKRLAESNAVEWLKLTDNPSGKFNPSGRLLAASFLLFSSQHGKSAQAAMQDLVVLEAPDDADPETQEACRNIALLASAQLWRVVVLRKPTERQLEKQRQTLELLPNEQRFGPLAIVAQGEKGLGRDEEAARDFLTAATLGADRFSVAEFAAKEAADAYERLGQKSVATKIREDSKRRFGD